MGENLEVYNGDYLALVADLSNFVSDKVSALEIRNPPWGGQNAKKGFMFLIVVNSAYWVAPKACMGQIEFVLREIEMADLQRKFGMQSSHLLYRDNLTLRQVGTGENVPVLRAWQRLPHIWIDIGNPACKRPFGELAQEKWKPPNPGKSMRQLGEWYAFNNLFGNTDRGPWNFVYDSVSDQILSIDHELMAQGGSIDLGGYRKMIGILIQGLPGDRADECREEFIKGFRDKWEMILQNQTNLTGMPVTATTQLARNRMAAFKREIVLQKLWA